jgi:aspartate carbamoyltransferase catalytic subunit
VILQQVSNGIAIRMAVMAMTLGAIDRTWPVLNMIQS